MQRAIEGAEGYNAFPAQRLRQNARWLLDEAPATSDVCPHERRRGLGGKGRSAFLDGSHEQLQREVLFGFEQDCWLKGAKRNFVLGRLALNGVLVLSLCW